MSVKYPFEQNLKDIDGNIIINLRDDVWIVRGYELFNGRRVRILCTECLGHLLLNKQMRLDTDFRKLTSSQPCDRCGALPRSSLPTYLGINYYEARKIVSTSGGKFVRLDGLTFRIKDEFYQNLK